MSGDECALTETTRKRFLQLILPNQVMLLLLPFLLMKLRAAARWDYEQALRLRSKTTSMILAISVLLIDLI